MNNPDTCPDCGSADYWHNYTDEPQVVKTVSCKATFRLRPGGLPMEQLTDKDGHQMPEKGDAQ